MPGPVIRTYLLSNRERVALEQHNWLSLLDHHDCSKIRNARAKRRNEFMLSRVLLRYVIGQAIPAIDPAHIDIVEHRDRPPLAAVARDHGLVFNISHSGDYVGVAVSADFPGGVGLDIEQQKPDRKLLETAAMICSRDELAVLKDAAANEPARLVDLFYRYWTRKEAALKSRGLGISAVRLGDIVDTALSSDSSVTVWSGRIDDHAMSVAAASEFALEVAEVGLATDGGVRLQATHRHVSTLALGPVALPEPGVDGAG